VSETSAEVIRRYLQDAIADAKNTEIHLYKFAEESRESEAKQLFQQLSLKAKTQHERLAARLAKLGGSSSIIHGLVSQLLGLGSKTSQVAHGTVDRTMQNLVAAFATEHGQVAVCEAIANMADAASDYDTAVLARTIRDEAIASAQKIWRLLPSEAAYHNSRSEERP
jgi:ferritin-like metal-binding protein YciE